MAAPADPAAPDAPGSGRELAVLILAGGGGTRFWPVSRRERPKQLLALDGERSLLQQTFDRIRPLVVPRRIWVCTGREIAAEVARQLPEVPAEQILAEPAGRNTAAAIGWSLLSMPPAARRGLVAVLPADHRIADAAAFRSALLAAAAVAERSGRVMTLGVRPHRPEGGYGHLELGEEIEPGGGACRVACFHEKPGAELARAYHEGGRHLWNAGIFVFRGEVLLELLARFEPALAAGLAEVAESPERIDELYPLLTSVSIDEAVMERAQELGTVALDCGWSDLGSWQALAEVLPADPAGNAVHGDVVALDASGNLLFAETGTIAVLGIEGLAVVRTADAVLVIPKDRAQEVRRIVAALAARGSGGLI